MRSRFPVLGMPRENYGFAVDIRVDPGISLLFYNPATTFTWEKPVSVFHLMD